MHVNAAPQLLSGQLPMDYLAALLPDRRIAGAEITRTLATGTSDTCFITLHAEDGPIRLFVKAASGSAHAAYREKNRRECAFSLPREYWAGSLPGLVRNFRRMGCGEMVRRLIDAQPAK